MAKAKKTKKEDIPITENSKVRMKKSGVEVFPLSEKGGFVSSFSTQPHKIISPNNKQQDSLTRETLRISRQA